MGVSDSHINDMVVPVVPLGVKKALMSRNAEHSALFVNKNHKVSFSYCVIFDRMMCVLVTLYERGHFVMLIIKEHASH